MADPPQSAGALCAQTLELAAGLVADAAQRSVGEWGGAAEAQAEALGLARRAVALGAINEEAYRGAVAALAGRLPPTTAATRDHLLGDMLDRAAEAPLALTKTAVDIVVLGALVGERAPGQAAADAMAAAAVAAGAARATTHLVAVNLATRKDDPRLYQARREVRRAIDALPEGM